MTSSRTRWTLPALVAAAVWAAPAAAQHQHGHQHAPPASAGTAVDSTLPYNERYAWTEADAHFMSSMIGHHAQAVDMARLAPERASSNSIRILAQRIINAQHDEIATMQTWLRDRGLPVPEADASHGGHGELMPGMLTPEQMARLQAATGAAFDQLFLELMIQHHRGAVSMVTRLFGTPGAGQDETVFKFASDVNVDQTTEINRMQRMLANLVFGGAAP
ncbi:MAG TPA: DUF305 domain-containing protein [Longimicrobium sp.]